jgi:hypothetical protein
MTEMNGMDRYNLTISTSGQLSDQREGGAEVDRPDRRPQSERRDAEIEPTEERTGDVGGGSCDVAAGRSS